MNINGLKNNLKLDEINDKCKEAFLKLKLFKFEIDHISYFKEHLEPIYKKYLYKDIKYKNKKYLFLGQLNEQLLILFPYKKEQFMTFYPIVLLQTKEFKNIKLYK